MFATVYPCFSSHIQRHLFVVYCRYYLTRSIEAGIPNCTSSFGYLWSGPFTPVFYASPNRIRQLHILPLCYCKQIIFRHLTHAMIARHGTESIWPTARSVWAAPGAAWPISKYGPRNVATRTRAIWPVTKHGPRNVAARTRAVWAVSEHGPGRSTAGHGNVSTRYVFLVMSCPESLVFL